MVSMAFSTTFHTAVHNFSQARVNSNSSPSWPSMAFVTPYTKAIFGSSKSSFFHHGFPQLSSSFPGFLLRSRSFGVYARAATDKTLHDFTVKVSGRSSEFKIFVSLFFWSLSSFSVHAYFEAEVRSLNFEHGESCHT